LRLKAGNQLVPLSHTIELKSSILSKVTAPYMPALSMPALSMPALSMPALSMPAQ